MRTIFLSAAILLLGIRSLFAQEIDWSKVEEVFGRKAAISNEVYKFTYPRSDLTITKDGIKILPGLALTTWVAFKKMESEAIMMGDLVVTDDELKAVERKMMDNSIEITAIHNHLSGETPPVKYIHYSSQGNPVLLAGRILEVLALTGTPTDTKSGVQTLPPDADWSAVESIMGYKGNKKGDLLQFSIARQDTISEMFITIPAQMGMATAINFQKVESGAVVTGDFVLTADEVEPVLNTLIRNNITVTALHNHMLFEKPKIFFMHFWGNDNPEILAVALKEALDKTNSVKK